MSLTVRRINSAEHLAYLASHPQVPLRQTPGWARGFESSRTESVGWFEDDRLIGAGLVRYRGLPRLPMRTVAVLAGGPDIDWTGKRRPGYSLSDWLEPLSELLRDQGAISVRVSPEVVEQDWWAIDPDQQAASSELQLRRNGDDRWEHRRTEQRLMEAGWQRVEPLPAECTAEVMVAGGNALRRINHLASSDALSTGYRVRAGTAEELSKVHRAITDVHQGVPTPGLRRLASGWEGLAAESPGSVKLLVVEQQGEPVYGGLVAVSGNRAWDLSGVLPQPHADRPEVQALRAHLIAHTAMTGSRSLVIPTLATEPRSLIRMPAPGWPPAQLRRMIGTWQFPLRANWHAALAAVVDRLHL